MLSYISSFSAVRGSIFIAVGLRLAALLLLYNSALALFPPSIELGGGLDNETEGRIIAERFIYSAEPEAVVVGSSLGRRLLLDLPTNFYDLSFSGGSPLTGAEIILRMNRQPKFVVIETNILERPANEELIRSLFAEPYFEARRLIPSARTEGRPSILFAYFASKITSRTALREAIKGPLNWRPWANGTSNALPQMQITASRIDRNGTSREDEDPRLAAGLKIQLAGAMTVSDASKARIKQTLEHLVRVVEQLRKRGACVLLMRLPIHPLVDASPLERYMDDAAHVAFPDRNAWMDWQNSGIFYTIDGVHLTDLSAKRAADVISARVTADNISADSQCHL